MALEVEGSNPFTHPIFLLARCLESCIISIRCCGPVAQLAEQGTLNPKVQGSNPCRSTIRNVRARSVCSKPFSCTRESRPAPTFASRPKADDMRWRASMVVPRQPASRSLRLAPLDLGSAHRMPSARSYSAHDAKMAITTK